MNMLYINALKKYETSEAVQPGAGYETNRSTN